MPLDRRTKAGRILSKAEDAGCQSIEEFIAFILVELSPSANGSPTKATSFRINPEAVEFLDTMLNVAGDSVLTSPWDNSWYRLCEWKLRDTELTLEDANTIGEFLANGGWKGKKPSVKQVLNWLPDLLAQAGRNEAYDPRYNV